MQSIKQTRKEITMVSVKQNKTKKLTVSSLAVLAMCLYAIMTSVHYINPALSIFNSLSLYAFLGLSVAVVLLNKKIKLDVYWMWYLGFILMALISTFYAPNQKASFNGIYNLVVVFGIIFSMSVVLTCIERVEMLMNSIVLGATVLMVYLIVTGEIDLSAEQTDRLGQELTGNANVFAFIYTIAACSSVYFLISKKNIFLKIFYLAPFIVHMLALALSGSRKNFLVPLIVLFITLLLKKDKHGKRHVIIWTIVGTVGLALVFYALMNIPALYETVGNRFETLFEYSSGASNTSDGSTLEREQMRKNAIELWIQSPIFGNGFDSFSQLGSFGVYSHCNYTELLCNHGLIGIVYYYSIWIYLLFRMIMCKNEHPMKNFLIGIIIGFLICDYGSVSYALPLMHTFLLFASKFLMMSGSHDVSKLSQV